MYIDKIYYDDTFQGIPIEDTREFNQAAKRASDEIDRLTNYRIKEEQLAEFQLKQLKMATSVLVEHITLEGGYEAYKENSSLGNVSIGSFSYGENNSENGTNSAIKDVIKHLTIGGLLYSGVVTYG